MSGKPREQAKFWRAEEFDNLELLHATYITHVFDKHYHEEYVVAVVVRSHYAFFCNGEDVIAGQGKIILINPGEIYSGYSITENGWTYRALYPSVSLMREIAEEVTGRHWLLPFFPQCLVEDDYAAGLLVNLHHTLEQGITNTQLERDVRLRTALGALIARHADNRALSTLRLGHERDAVQRVCRYLEAHYMGNPSLDDLARIAGLSP